MMTFLNIREIQDEKKKERKKERKKKCKKEKTKERNGRTDRGMDRQTDSETGKYKDDRQTDNTNTKFLVSQNFVENKFSRNKLLVSKFGIKT
jgi:hypothetical protein